MLWLWFFDDFVVDFSDAFEEEVEGVFGGVGAGDDQGGFDSFDSAEEFVDGFFGAAGALDGEALEDGVELPRLLIGHVVPLGHAGVDVVAELVDQPHTSLDGKGAPPEPLFTPADHAALAGPWSWLHTVVEQAMDGGLGGMVDDDLACVAPWGFDPGPVRPPVLFVHGRQDRMVPSAHGRWLARQTPSAELWLRPDDGHVSVLHAGDAALGWLWEHARQR
jgi:pimeloyl-ACP methyl ester carboxylesterase